MISSSLIAAFSNRNYNTSSYNSKIFYNKQGTITFEDKKDILETNNLSLNFSLQQLRNII
ncbi:MAG TPA: hypothetical protein VFR65_10895 [Nitrososphaeraceae archaeon]|nr:hypothetical protein [Nitrososphaeraceae archaeon]